MLFLYALAKPIILSSSGEAFADSQTNSSTLFDPITGECDDIKGCRTVTGILWSCLSVIFICTWVAIHPNIPKVGTHSAVVVFNNVMLMMTAVLAPEIMVLWAMRQRASAKAIGKKFEKYGWGITHGFFVIMGGFALYDGNEFCGYLWDSRDPLWQEGVELYEGRIRSYHQYIQKAPESALSRQENGTTIHIPSDASCLLEFLVAKGYITLTEDEIRGNFSHGDVFTKSIAVVQTLWFILQVAARGKQGLAISELEIITVGFAVLNFGTYFLWWKKPVRVRHPIRIYWRPQETETTRKPKGSQSRWNSFRVAVATVIEHIYSPGNPKSGVDWAKLICLPIAIVLHVFFICDSILSDKNDYGLDILISSRLESVPVLLYVAVYGLAAIFGVIHCIPWIFSFPSISEQQLWRISAVAVAAAPIVMGCLHMYWKRYLGSAPVWLDTGVSILIIILAVGYAVFRVMLIALAFTALRNLPPSAYQTVQWTTFIPHIG
ncbi:hypothetical protein VNI00_013926 [Paramarasmius palmivorus]|uniref:Uncharacterized protein n=1 Tax=Paramarasmius palmivorus TaxID=297713 RepID=A0AAW0BW07_9AGAR